LRKWDLLLYETEAFSALPILVFANIADTDIADIFWADTGTNIPDNRNSVIHSCFLKINGVLALLA